MSEKNITVTIPVCLNFPSRVNYFEECVKSLSIALRHPDMDNFRDSMNIVFGVEPFNQRKAMEIIQKNLNNISYTILQNKRRKGVRHNPYYLLSTAFDEIRSDFNIHLEDDVVYSSNIFVVAKWFYENFKKNPLDYYAYGLFNYMRKNEMKKRSQDIYKVVEKDGFIGLGWCIFKENWVEHKFKENWLKDIHPFKFGWDWSINYYMKTNNFKYLTIDYPMTKHVSGQDGTHCTQKHQETEFDHIDLYNGDYDYNKIYIGK